MKYFRNINTAEVFGYEDAQSDLIAEAEANPDLEDVTGSWPPAPGEGPPQPYQLYKTKIYERMTDAELATFNTSMNAAPLRERLMWQDCITVNSDSPYFLQLHTAMVAAFGAERADAILAGPHV